MTRHPASRPVAVTNASPQRAHPFCFVCSPSNPLGLGLRLEPQEDGSVCAAFVGHPVHEGHCGLVHAGIVAALLDGAMIHCLLARGWQVRTVELRVRYHLPIALGQELRIQAWHESSSRHGLHRARGEVRGGGQIMARAQGKFLQVRE